MKKQKITGKLAIKKYDFAELGTDSMHQVKGGANEGAAAAPLLSKTKYCEPIPSLLCATDKPKGD